MTPFQYIILATLGLVAVTLVVGAARGTVGRLTASVWLVVLVIGGVLAVDPELTTAIARKVGIRRGADLLLYVLVLAVLQGFLLVYLRLRRLRREMTELVRHIALRDAESRADGRGGG